MNLIELSSCIHVELNQRILCIDENEVSYIGTLIEYFFNLRTTVLLVDEGGL